MYQRSAQMPYQLLKSSVDALGIRHRHLGTWLLHRSDLVAPRKKACMPNSIWVCAHHKLSPVGRVCGALFFILVTRGVDGAAPVRKGHCQPHAFGDVPEVKHACLFVQGLQVIRWKPPIRWCCIHLELFSQNR